MPLLSRSVSLLLQDTRFTAADLVSLRQAIQARTATLQDAKNLAIYFADTLEPGVGSWLKALLTSLGSSVNVERPIPNLSRETALLNGQVALPGTNARHPSVRSVQRSLIALGSRTREPAYLLRYGADGSYGNETQRAMKVFQQRHGLAATGRVDAATARSLHAALQRTRTPGISQASSGDLVEAAQELCAPLFAQYYGVEQSWVNLDPNHNVRVNRPFDDLRGRWKCNLFGGNVMRKGGYEPPYYGNRGRGEYPNANQWFRWSDRYAPQSGNKTHFQWVAEVAVESLSAETARGAIADLLRKTQPGDFLLQDHPGSQVADGGHVRVALSNEFLATGTVSFAQAQYTKAGVRQEGVEQLMGSEKIWLLRPLLKM